MDNLRKRSDDTVPSVGVEVIPGGVGHSELRDPGDLFRGLGMTRWRTSKPFFAAPSAVKRMSRA